MNSKIKKTAILLFFSYLFDTKMLQNPNNKKFDEVENITRQYMAMPDAKNAIYPMMITDPIVLAQLERYRFIKESSKKGLLNNPITSGNSILMNDENENKIIAIKDYVTWLNCNYGLSLTTKPPVDTPTNLTTDQLCSGKHLSSFSK